MSNLIKHAMLEFKALGWVNDQEQFVDPMQQEICQGVLNLLEMFSDQGHSGTSAPYTIGLFSKLAKFEALGPLTGEPWEWIQHDDGVYQNRRCSSVFKRSDRFDGKPYWIDGKVFWNWVSVPGEEPFKSYYTTLDSFVVIEFPWQQPSAPEYVFVPTPEFLYE